VAGGCARRWPWPPRPWGRGRRWPFSLPAAATRPRLASRGSIHRPAVSSPNGGGSIFFVNRSRIPSRHLRQQWPSPRADPDQHLDGAWRRLRPGAWCSATSLAGVGFGSVDCDGDGMGADQIEVVCNGDGSRQRGTFEAATRFTALMPVGLA
jgi:hypothetical protein